MVDPNVNSENSNASVAISGAISTAKDAAVSVGEKAKSAAADVVDTAKQELNGVKDDIAARVTDGSNSAANSLSTLADKLAEAKPDLDRSLIGPFVQQTESSLRSAATYLEGSTPSEYLTDFASFARKNPAVALGGAIAIGFLMARAAKVASKNPAS